MDNYNRMKELTSLLNKASDAYYNTDKPIMADKEYDKLYDELVELESEGEFYGLDNSPTQKVGHEVKSKLDKVKHDIPLKSLGKTKSIDELKKFVGDREVVVMLKLDGLTNSLEYNKYGHFTKGSTRGNGNIGEDITHSVKRYKNFLGYVQGCCNVVGEAVIKDGEFENINSKLSNENKYKNSRNLVAGTIRSLDNKVVADRNVRFYAFGIQDSWFKTKIEELCWLESEGFDVVPWMKANSNSIESTIKMLRIFASENGFPIDGIVITFNDIDYGKSKGETAHHPLHSLAFKFEDSEEETEYIRTEWRTSRTGQLNPVAIFKPVDIEGSTVERATLHNVDYFEELQLGVSDIISVIKANEVIPKVIGNYTRSNTEKIPEVCPVCGGKTEVRLLKTSRVLFCTNDDCPSRKIAQFEHYCSRDAMNIMGVSEAILETFIDKGFIKTIPDLYNLEQYKYRIVSMDGFGHKSYEKIIKAINDSKICKLDRLLFALGIPNVGKGTAKDIAKYFKGSIDNFMDAVGWNFNFSDIEDIGEITNKSIHNWFDNPINVELINKLHEILTIEKDEIKNSSYVAENPFKGKNIYCTGTFEAYKKEQLKQLVESLGAEFASGYAKSLDYLIVGSVKGSGKVDKALKDGVKVLQEEDFLKMIG